jgi:hypothetical protein
VLGNPLSHHPLPLSPSREGYRAQATAGLCISEATARPNPGFFGAYEGREGVDPMLRMIFNGPAAAHK